MVLMYEVRIVEGKPQVEGYAAGELAARADLVVPGAGPLGGMLAALVGEVAGAGAAGWSRRGGRWRSLSGGWWRGSVSWAARCCSTRWMRGRPRRCGWRRGPGRAGGRGRGAGGGAG